MIYIVRSIQKCVNWQSKPSLIARTHWTCKITNIIYVRIVGAIFPSMHMCASTFNEHGLLLLRPITSTTIQFTYMFVFNSEDFIWESLLTQLAREKSLHKRQIIWYWNQTSFNQNQTIWNFLVWNYIFFFSISVWNHYFFMDMHRFQFIR